ncbi:MAG TPA: energy-coupling factor ABC transporter ATP-binding protein [Firmicutes bacterium]|nr:energy-coupling factor ABC transporter ATP-binding protein [Bacillota bacterium]
MGSNIIETKGIVFTYADGTKALSELTLTLPAGKRIAVLGANGSGKTTLFLCLNGILRPQKGEIFFAGERLRYDKKSLHRLRSKLGIVFQDPEVQLFAANVQQEVAFGPLNLGLPEKEVRRRVRQALTLTGMTGLEEKATHMLSYGQKKQAAIASVLAMEPDVLIGDEPTAWLDQSHAGKVMELFHKISKQGTTVIISTHDTDLAFSWAEEIILLGNGKLLGIGPAEAVFLDKGLLTAAGLSRPLLLEIFILLKERGRVTNEVPAPRTLEALACLIKE